ncbi:interleukin-27 receptor subunit alpha [Thamnophis elegans]|uniref:interleukin-27 receptor subunit alpha n=1 Tax=Thamnophis elegans TaxID=35005 RepID=UPI0013775F2A|nr:interleukin-27 receptor subunit alpha [Thamnophis elegans]XP_032067280.1 interleukin-27 receptor subunit alpha [Thamnophis elegans]
MRSRWGVAALLLLAVKILGLKKGDPDATMGLRCFQPFPSNIVNCSWLTWESQNANATYFLYYESLKLDKVLLNLNQGLTSIEAQTGQNWLVIKREDLIRGDKYSFWMEIRSADGIAISKKLNFSLDEIVKPCPPELDHVESDSSEATVTWKNPHWSQLHNDQPLTYAIRYKASTDHEWTYLPETHPDQENHEFGDLKPFTCYEVQVRCIPENKKDFWSDWSSSKLFCTCEAAPLGQVDVWQKKHVSDHQNESHFLLWKALDPDAAQGKILDYEVIFQDHSKIPHRMNYNCCQASIPIAAQYVSIAARNSVNKTPWANFSLEKTELPGPEEVTVVASEGLGLNVTWKPSMDPQWVQPQEYVVEWRKEIGDRAGEFLNWTRTLGSSTSILLKGNFSSKVPYLVCVYGLYADGIAASDSVRAYFKEEVPSAGPQGLQDRRLSSSATSISWKEIPLAERNGHVIHYTLYLQRRHSDSSMVHGHINATERNYTVSDLEPGTTYQVWMTGSTSAGEGVASAKHHFSTSVFHWEIIVVVFLLALILLVMGSMVLLKYQRLVGLCHKVLPRWCWEKIPDPKHSGIAVEINEESTAPAIGSTQFPEVMDIAEISEEIPEPSPLLTRSTAMVISGYEKRSLPTQEEILNWFEQERNNSPFSRLRERET